MTSCVIVRGEQVPALGLGTGQLLDETCYRAVRHALDVGYRHLDTAQFYDNEEAVGRALKDSGLDRDEVFVTTKVWRSNLTRERVSPSLQQSLKQLGLDHVDLVLIHWPVAEVPIAETITALREAQAAGLTRHLGTSNFTPTQLRAASAHASVFCNQVEYHPLLSQEAVLAAAEELDHLVTAYSPIALGQVAAEPVITQIAADHQRTPAQIALRWLLQQPRVAAIPRSGRPEHISANFAVFDFTLSPSEMAAMFRLSQGRTRLSNPEWAPDWEH